MLQRLFISKYLLTKSRASVVRIIALLSVSGVAVGVMAMVVVLSVMNGFDEAIRTRLLNVEAHLRIKGVEPKAEIEAILKKVLGNQGELEPFSTQDVIVRTLDGLYSGGVARGVDARFIDGLTKLGEKTQVFEIENRPIDGSVPFTLGPKEVGIGIELAHSLGIFSGDEVSIIAPESLLLPAGELPIYERVKVKALLRTDVPHFDSHAVVFNADGGMSRLTQVASLEQGYEIKLNKLSKVNQVKKDFEKVLNGRGNVETWEQLNPGLFYSLKMEKISMAIFLGLTILVSCFSIVTVLVLLVTEKRTDVGILRTMGAPKKQIRQIFLTVGSALGFAGILGGLFLGLVICFVLDRFPVIKLPNIYYDTSIPVSMDWLVIAGIIILGSILTVLGTLVPAIRVAKLNPVDAIRRVDE